MVSFVGDALDTIMAESPKHTPDLECFALSEMLQLPSSLGYVRRHSLSFRQLPLSLSLSLSHSRTLWVLLSFSFSLTAFHCFSRVVNFLWPELVAITFGASRLQACLLICCSCGFSHCASISQEHLPLRDVYKFYQRAQREQGECHRRGRQGAARRSP